MATRGQGALLCTQLHRFSSPFCASRRSPVNLRKCVEHPAITTLLSDADKACRGICCASCARDLRRGRADVNATESGLRRLQWLQRFALAVFGTPPTPSYSVCITTMTIPLETRRCVLILKRFKVNVWSKTLAHHTKALRYVVFQST